LLRSYRILLSTGFQGRLEMNAKDFFKTGHPPTLLAAFLYFDVSFMVWVLLGPLAPFLGEQLHLSATEKGFLTAIPLLGGSLFRPILGVLGDRLGQRKTGLLGLGLTLVPLLLGWRFAHTPGQFYFLGLLLGIGGASFAVALPLAGRWYPREYQGLVMGIAGAGNSGTLVAALFAPRLAQKFGCANTFALAMIPVLLVIVVFVLLAKDSPKQGKVPAWRDYASVLRESDTAWFCFFYCFTFGGFVGLASFLTVFFHDQYGLTKVRAGDFTTIVVLAGSFLRPIGGWLSDRFGGYRLLLVLLTALSMSLFAVGTFPPLSAEVGLLFLSMGMLGMGNGAVFQLVPQRFPKRIGILTGLVGAAGGFGGFLLPSILGTIKDRTGQYSFGLYLIAGGFLAASLMLLHVGTQWQANWHDASVDQAGIFSYRKLFRNAAQGIPE
jgi:MFS transporter, NNP family, nitrate/nitrite transporter